MNRPQQTYIVAIAHGASERIFCESIRSNLRIQMKVMLNNKSSTQITSLEDFFKRDDFTSPRKFARENGLKFTGGRITNLEIYTIMDTDDCMDPATLQQYKGGTLLHNSYAEYIVPIYNTPNLDDVLIRAGYHIDIKNKRRSYEANFPGTNDGQIFFDLETRISKLPRDFTNMDLFLSRCSEEARKKEIGGQNLTGLHRRS